jgi:hypothetical protein
VRAARIIGHLLYARQAANQSAVGEAGMLRKFSLLLFAVMILACASFAQDHPNFAGTWKLNLSKSNGGDYGPTTRTDVITQDGAKFTQKVTSVMAQLGESDYTLTFTADGNKVTVAPDSPQSDMGVLTLKDLTASWGDASLILTTDSSYQGQVDITNKSTYTLSSDGKTLTITSHISTSGAPGDFDTTLVFDKQ